MNKCELKYSRVLATIGVMSVGLSGIALGLPGNGVGGGSTSKIPSKASPIQHRRLQKASQKRLQKKSATSLCFEFQDPMLHEIGQFVNGRGNLDKKFQHFLNIYSKFAEALGAVTSRKIFQPGNKIQTSFHLVEINGSFRGGDTFCGEGCKFSGSGTLSALAKRLETDDLDSFLIKLFDNGYCDETSNKPEFSRNEIVRYINELQEEELPEVLKLIAEYTGRDVYLATVRAGNGTLFGEFIDEFYKAHPKEGPEFLLGYGGISLGNGYVRKATVSRLETALNSWSDSRVLKAIGKELRCDGIEAPQINQIYRLNEINKRDALLFVLDKEEDKLYGAYSGSMIDFSGLLNPLYQEGPFHEWVCHSFSKLAKNAGIIAATFGVYYFWKSNLAYGSAEPRTTDTTAPTSDKFNQKGFGPYGNERRRDALVPYKQNNTSKGEWENFKKSAKSFGFSAGEHFKNVLTPLGIAEEKGKIMKNFGKYTAEQINKAQENLECGPWNFDSRCLALDKFKYWAEKTSEIGAKKERDAQKGKQILNKGFSYMKNTAPDLWASTKDKASELYSGIIKKMGKIKREKESTGTKRYYMGEDDEFYIEEVDVEF